MRIFAAAKESPKKNKRASRYAIKASVSQVEYQELQERCGACGCTMADLVRGALRLDQPSRERPLLVCAGQLLRAGNAHAAASAGNDEQTAMERGDELRRLAVELIALAVEQGELR
ncbi:MAG: hypothetical protein K2X59_01345 [Sphingomonas sp.]|nr:hypothetical protein [Sphingomonas sp.]